METPTVGASGEGVRRQLKCAWDRDRLLEATQDANEFFRYCTGVAYEMFSRPGVTGGIDLRITATDLPLRKGVSSSAAVCILVAKAFDAAYKLGMFPHELMEVAYRGERLTGSECGRMDQACIYGKVPVLLTFQDSGTVRVEPIFPAGTIHMFFVDLAGRKDTVKILSDLQAAYKENADLQGALGRRSERIVRLACRALAAGNAAELGRLMSRAQEVFDEFVAPHSPVQLASPLLHGVLRMSEISSDVYGGKGVGSQGDGTAQFVARSVAAREAAMEKITRAMPLMRCFPLTIAPLRTSVPGQDAGDEQMPNG